MCGKPVARGSRTVGHSDGVCRGEVRPQAGRCRPRPRGCRQTPVSRHPRCTSLRRCPGLKRPSCAASPASRSRSVRLCYRSVHSVRSSPLGDHARAGLPPAAGGRVLVTRRPRAPDATRRMPPVRRCWQRRTATGSAGSTGGASRMCGGNRRVDLLVKLRRQGDDRITMRVLAGGEIRLDPLGLTTTVVEVYGPGAPSPKTRSTGFPGFLNNSGCRQVPSRISGLSALAQSLSPRIRFPRQQDRCRLAAGCGVPPPTMKERTRNM